MPHTPTLASLADDLENGRTSARKLVDECIARIADPAGEGQRVFIHVDKDAAIEAAEAMDHLRKARAAPSRFAGIPVSIKDLFDIKGQVTRAGSRALDDSPPAPADAAAVARLRRAGFIVIGRTNMTEFAYSGIGINPHFGTPKGAWNRAEGHVPGPMRHFEQTAAITPELRAEGVKKIVGVADLHKLTTAGVFSSGEYFEGVFNSRRLTRWHTQTSAEVSVTMLAADSSGWQKANSPNVADLDPLKLAEIAAQKAVNSAHPREHPPGKYTVILEPAAVLDIVGFMFGDYSGTAILDQRSFLTGRIGSRLFGENITILDDVADPLQAGSPFDGEGVVRKKVGLVENGVVNRVVYARATAERMKRSE
ncbi:MAG: hypothetical protein KGK16_04260, partial [Bradyrhizobium sp.]|nr:hypothetical protein [Bradyrhizobium sp.]